MTRRQFLLAGTTIAAAAGAAAAGLRIPPVMAAAANSVKLGEAEVTVVSDGSLTQPMSFVLPYQTPEQIAELGITGDEFHPDCNVTVMRTPDRLVLFDAGSGPLFQNTAGKLVGNLNALGVDPAEVTDVVFTHAHPDHIWGVIDDFDELVFSEARYYVPRAEWDFWRSDGALAALPENRQNFVAGARNRFDAIEDLVTMIEPGEEVLPGVEVVGTPGHTPGHVSYMVHGGGDSVLVIGDAILNAVISFERPDWHVGPDQDPELGAKTRMALLDRIAAEKARIIGFHLPYPAIGTAERAGGVYRFVSE
jgi:glyoxylase-like metal-dependent hydrolase (beta-lactamase superfamily II)